MREVIIDGDGYCFPNAVRKCLMHDFYKFYTIQQIQDIVCEHLAHNFEEYVIFHHYSCNELIEQAKQFFNEGQFNRDIVDIFVHATGKALKIQLNIFRRSPGGNILEIFQGDSTSSRSINLKLSGTGGIYTGDNHYDALPIRYKHIESLPPIEEEKDKSEKDKSRDLPSSSYIDLTSGIFKSPVKKSVGVDEFIDLTESPVKLPGSISDTEEPYASTEEESVSARSDLTERIASLDDVLSEAGEDVETEVDTGSHELHLESENVDEVIELYLRPSTIFPSFLFRKTKPKKVDFLPHNINGNVYYKVRCTLRNYSKKTSDRRWFYMRTSSRKGLKGIRKVGTCKGSWKCTNDRCSFLMKEKKPNTWHFEYRGGSKACYSCGLYADQVPCGARKMIEIAAGADHATVQHIGTHNCTLQQEVTSDLEFTKKWIERYPGLNFRDLRSQVIQQYLDSGDSKEAEQAAYRITDQAFRKIKRTMKAESPLDLVEVQSLEAVGHVKEGSDKVDPFHVYKINSKRLNNKPDYVMKSSSKILKLAVEMDVDGPDNPLKAEDAFFDGSHSRCTDFISLGLWMLHTPMRRIIRLASMEVRTEKTEELTIFWELLNEMLEKITKKTGYKFNPNYIMFDEAGANFTSVKGVFGDEFVKNRVVSCQWHFMNKVMERIHKIGEEDQGEFAEKAGQMCRVPTVPEFELLYRRLKEICEKYPDVGNFLDWYYVRRTHLFPAFREGRHSGVNQAEIGNAKWKTTQHRKLSLVAAARDDISTMMQQEVDVRRYEEGSTFRRGSAPTDVQRATKERRAQIEQGRSFAQILQNEAALEMQREAEENPEYFLPSSKASHKPGKKTTSVQGKIVSGKGKGRGKGLGGKDKVTPTFNELLEKLNRAKRIERGEEVVEPPPPQQPQITAGMPVLGQGPEPRKVRPIKSTEQFPNPPFIVQNLVNVSVCQGCPRKIDLQIEAPHDMFVRMKGVRPYKDKNTLIWIDRVANIYFHLSLECLKKFDATFDETNLTMTDELFYNISNQHLQHLAGLGLLKHIIANKGKQLAVSKVQKK